MERLRLKIPPLPDDFTISDLHYTLEVVEAIDIVAGIGGGDALMAIAQSAGAGKKLSAVLEAAGEVAEGFLAVAAPLATPAAKSAPLGLPYAEPRAAIARKRLASGISFGVAMAADDRRPRLLKDYF